MSRTTFLIQVLAIFGSSFTPTDVKSRLTLCITLATLICFGCQKAPEKFVVRSLQATNVVWRPSSSTAELQLSGPQAERFKTVVRRFLDSKARHLEKDMFGYKYGSFWCDGAHFDWQGDMLYYFNSPKRCYVVINDETLSRMSMAYMKAIGTNLPLKQVTDDGWLEILDQLSK